MELLQNIKEVLRTISRRTPTEIYCPACGSSRIRLSSRFDYFLTPKKFVCQDCGYTGPIVMELEEQET